jgi:hypothetical protein
MGNTMRHRVETVAVVCSLFLAAVVCAVPAQTSDLDQLMSLVLQKRDENWKKLRQYLLDEREEVALVASSGFRLWGDRREYTWFIRDGVFVRSPLRANGVTVSDADRRIYEDAFAKRAKAREASGRAAESADTTSAQPKMPESQPAAEVDTDSPASAEALLSGMRQPQFIDSAYFLRFKFEGGRYAFVGRETFAGREVLRIEYYPEKLFVHEQNDQDRRRRRREANRNEDVEAAVERMLNKVALVTIWVEPSAQQIVKYTFDNVDLDFLPAARFLRITDAEATMTMAEAFPTVWLPSMVTMRIGAMFAAGSVDVRYNLEYHNYREAASSGRMLPP